jgi:hypothetical protein
LEQDSWRGLKKDWSTKETQHKRRIYNLVCLPLTMDELPGILRFHLQVSHQVTVSSGLIVIHAKDLANAGWSQATPPF